MEAHIRCMMFYIGRLYTNSRCQQNLQFTFYIGRLYTISRCQQNLQFTFYIGRLYHSIWEELRNLKQSITLDATQDKRPKKSVIEARSTSFPGEWHCSHVRLSVLYSGLLETSPVYSILTIQAGKSYLGTTCWEAEQSTPVHQLSGISLFFIKPSQFQIPCQLSFSFSSTSSFSTFMILLDIYETFFLINYTLHLRSLEILTFYRHNLRVFILFTFR